MMEHITVYPPITYPVIQCPEYQFWSDGLKLAVGMCPHETEEGFVKVRPPVLREQLRRSTAGIVMNLRAADSRAWCSAESLAAPKLLTERNLPSALLTTWTVVVPDLFFFFLTNMHQK